MIIPKELIKAMAPLAADRKDPRPEIRSVRLERAGGQARAVATNGRVLMVAQWREPSAADLPFPLSAIEGERRDFGASVVIEDWKALAPMTPTVRDKQFLEAVAVSERASEGRLEAGSFDLETEQRRQVRTVGQKYPDWRAIMPEYRIAGDEANAVGLLVSAVCLAALLKSFIDAGAVGRIHDEVLLIVPLARPKEDESEAYSKKDGPSVYVPPVMIRGWNEKKSIEMTAIQAPPRELAKAAAEYAERRSGESVAAQL